MRTVKFAGFEEVATLHSILIVGAEEDYHCCRANVNPIISLLSWLEHAVLFSPEQFWLKSFTYVSQSKLVYIWMPSFVSEGCSFIPINNLDLILSHFVLSDQDVIKT